MFTTLTHEQNGRLFRDLSVIALFVYTLLVLLTFQDYGITHDEEVQRIYGEMLLNFYASGFSDQSAFSYLDLYRYGGFFDMLAALLNHLTPFGLYETRHLLGGLFGVLGAMGAWRLGRLLGGERLGFLALMLLVLTPAFYGHSFNNPKDGPFASAMIWVVYYICRVLPNLTAPKRSVVLKLGLAFGIALSIRVGALLVVPYVGLAVLLHLWFQHRRGLDLRAIGAELWLIVRKLLPALAVAYVVMAVFWPWAVMNPLNPIKALIGFSTYPINLQTLVEGEWVDAAHLPPDYIPVYLAVNLPELVLVGLIAGLVLAAVWLWRGKALKGEARLLQYLMVLLAAAFPVLFFVVAKPTAYNGLRHFLFVVPPLCVLAAAALERCWQVAESWHLWTTRIFTAVLTAAVTVQTWTMVQLHPDQYVYFNSLVGGVKGAQGSFELDYWGNSLIEATERLAEYLEGEQGGAIPPGTVYKVAVCGHPLSAAYFFPPWMQLSKELGDADFVISFTQANCHKRFRGKQIIAVERMGAALSVVKDRRAIKGTPTANQG